MNIYCFIVCKGRIELLHDRFAFKLNAEDLRKQVHGKNKNRFQHKIKKKNNGEYIKYEYAKVTGDCCWQIRSRFPPGSGQSYDISTAKTDTGGWPIKKVVLTECIMQNEEEDGKESSQQFCSSDNCDGNYVNKALY